MQSSEVAASCLVNKKQSRNIPFARSAPVVAYGAIYLNSASCKWINRHADTD
jgi:hypothetical protein